MRIAQNWTGYEMLDTSGGEKLERWGDVVLVRPDPQIIWDTPRQHTAWKRPHAHYHRSEKGGGSWENFRPFPESWPLSYGDLTFKISPTGFKHTGLFPEQAVNWDLFRELIGKAGRPVSVLNLFAYTGGATLACAAAGASVCHVDASKGMVAWAKENAALSGLAEKPVRWIVDDCEKFVTREIRRGRRYDAIILDPPSYGRGPSGEVWKLENHCTAATAGSLLGATVGKRYGGRVSADEIGLPVTASGLALPCGSTALWTSRDLDCPKLS